MLFSFLSVTQNFPIHVKLDTGMHRLGFAVEDIPLLIRRLKNQSAVIPRSVFSHLVGSDSSQFDDFTRGQIELFEKGSQELQAAFSHKILRHICNTAGIERFPDAQFDMVAAKLQFVGHGDKFDRSSNVQTYLSHSHRLLLKSPSIKYYHNQK